METSLWRYVRRHHVALLALFVALGGTAYAAAQLPANQSVDFAANQLPQGPQGLPASRECISWRPTAHSTWPPTRRL